VSYFSYSLNVAQILNVAFQGPTTIHICKHIILVREIIRTPYGVKTPMINLGPTFSIIFNYLIINKIFPTKFHHFLSKIHEWSQDSPIWREDFHQDPKNTYSSHN